MILWAAEMAAKAMGRDNCGPAYYDRKLEKWPRTQTFSPPYEVGSAVFLKSRANYSSVKARIGLKPKLFASPGMASLM
jgi:hypothetical protein